MFSGTRVWNSKVSDGLTPLVIKTILVQFSVRAVNVAGQNNCSDAERSVLLMDIGHVQAVGYKLHSVILWLCER